MGIVALVVLSVTTAWAFVFGGLRPADTNTLPTRHYWVEAGRALMRAGQRRSNEDIEAAFAARRDRRGVSVILFGHRRRRRIVHDPFETPSSIDCNGVYDPTETPSMID